MKKFEYAIIGAGSAGLNARREIAKVSSNYIVLDPGILGTTCARVGCMPSKVLIQVALDYDRHRKFAEEGILCEGMSIDSKKVMAHVRKLRDRFVRGVMGGMESWRTESNFLPKRASFVDEHTLDLGDEKIHADKIIIATGSSPFIPSEFKEFSDFLVTTDTFFEMESLPKSVAVVGLGVIGIELGQALDQLDVETTMIARRRIIAGVSDPVIREYVCSKMEAKHKIWFDGITGIERSGDQLLIRSLDREVKVDKVLMTAGRKANLSSLNLDNLKINCDALGFPLHSKKTFALDDYPHIYIVGDVNGDNTILHEATDEGKIAGLNATCNNQRPHKTRTPLEISFSDPNIAKAGKSYQDLVSAGVEFETGEVSFEGQGRSIVKLKEEGLLHIYGDKQTGKLLGAEMYGPDMEHIAHLLSWCMEMQLTVNKVISMPFYHPVIEEGLRSALRSLRDKCLEEKPDIEIYDL